MASKNRETSPREVWKCLLFLKAVHFCLHELVMWLYSSRKQLKKVISGRQEE